MSLKTKGGKSLINIALLESFRARKGGDYLDCFMPLICTCLAEDSSEKITSEKIYELLKKNFLTNIPQASVKALIKRAVKKNILTIESGIYTKNHSEIEKIHLNYKTAAKEIIKAQNELGKKFLEYAKSKFNKEYDDNYFFEEYAKYLQKYLLDFVELSLGPNTGPGVIGKSAGNIEYVISSFLKDCWLQEKGFPEYVEINMRGFLLANYLGYFESNLQDRLKAFQVYFDTPILIGVLGFSGGTRCGYYKEIIQHALNCGIKLFVFEKTLEEVDGILYAYQLALKNNDKKSMNPSTYSYLVNKGYTPEALESTRQLVKKQLEDLGIISVASPDYQKEYQMDEEKFQDYLKQEGFIAGKTSTLRDVDYVSAIHRLRFAKKITNSSSKIPVYFTNNKGLVKASMKFFYEDEGIKNDENSIPHCITDTFLASLILIKNPTEGVKASKKKLLAEAYSSIHVTDEFWNKFYKRIDTLLERGQVDQSDYAILRFNHEIRTLVGDQRVVEEHDDIEDFQVFDILKSYKEKLTSEKDKEISHHKAKIDSLDEHNKALEDKNSNLGEMNENLSEKVISLSRAEKGLDRVCNYLAYFVTIIFSSLFLLVTFTDSFYDFLFSPLNNLKFYIKVISFIVAIIITFYGFNPKYLQSFLKNKIKDWLQK